MGEQVNAILARRHGFSGNSGSVYHMGNTLEAGQQTVFWSARVSNKEITATETFLKHFPADFDLLVQLYDELLIENNRLHHVLNNATGRPYSGFVCEECDTEFTPTIRRCACCGGPIEGRREEIA